MNDRSSRAFLCRGGLVVCALLAVQGPRRADAAGKGAGPRTPPVSVLNVAATNRAAVDRLVAGGYDVDGVWPGRARVHADADEIKALAAEGFSFSVLPPVPAPPRSAQKGLGSYNTYADMSALLAGYAASNPAVCRLTTIGQSVQGRELWALKITDQPDVQEDEPEFRYMATIHGNESISGELCLYLIDHLLTGCRTGDVRCLNLVTNAEIWIVPVLNPDGLETSSRYNANWEDLNRSFPEGSFTNLGNVVYGPALSFAGLEPEVAAVMRWTETNRFVLGANFHSGALLVNYPYDNDGAPQNTSVYLASPDDALYQSLSRSYSFYNPPMWSSPYFGDGIVNGGDWYVVSGGLQDWCYRRAGSCEVTIEVSDDFQPSTFLLPQYWAENREAMLAHLERGLEGVRGVLRDARTGAPVSGAVRVEGIHHLVFSDPDAGDYHRLLLPGTYTLWAYAPGYLPRRIPGVAVTGGPAVRVDVDLEPAGGRFAAKVNFQPAAVSAIPAGFVKDTGAVFGARGNGYSYGWEASVAGGMSARWAARARDVRYDTFAQMQSGGSHTWEIAVPSGPYAVLVGAGDPNATAGTYRIAAEGRLLADGAARATNRWVEGLGTVVVTDGRLTLSNAAGAVSNRLAFVEISSVEPSSIEEWRALYFATTNDAGAAADGADDDHDGLVNLAEYAGGTSPTNAEAAGRLAGGVVATNGGEHLTLQFLRNASATDLTFLVEAGDAVTGTVWAGLATNRHGGGWQGGPVTEDAAVSNRVRVTARDPEPLGARTGRTLRVRTTRP